MATLPNGSIAEVRFFTSLGDQTAVMVRHYRISGTGPAGTDVQLATAIGTGTPTFIKDVTAATATYRGLSVQSISPGPKTQAVFNTAGSGPGTVAGETLPPQTAGVITLRTQFAGRQFRGRAYSPFPGESDNSAGGGLTVAASARLQALADQLTAIFDFGTNAGEAIATPVVYSRKFGTSETIEAGIARPGWGTQRRRGFFGQQNISPV